jgi:prevent-host-death family protein
VKIAPVAEVKAKFSAYLKASERGPIVVTRKGKAVAVLLSLTADEDVERLVLANSPKFQSLLDVARQQIREDKGIPHEEFWAEVQGHRPTGQGHRPVP